MSFDIEKLYKENTENTVPDMDKLWDRIEARLDEQEKADSKTQQHDITPSARPKKIRWSALITVAACAVIAVTGAFVMMNRNEVKTGNTSSVSETKKKSSEKSGIAKASDEENNAEISYDAENDGFFGLHTSDDKTENEAEEIADETAAENTGDAAAEEQEVQAAEQAPKNDTSASDHTSAATAAKSDRTSTTAASDNTAASDTTHSAEDISKKIEARVNELLESDEYQDADAGQKAELVSALFDEMMREGAVTSYDVDELTGEAYCTGDGFTVTVTLGI